MSWKKLSCKASELQLTGTLNGGQSFRWTQDKIIDEWTGVFEKSVWKLRREEDVLLYQILGSKLKNEHKKKSKHAKVSNDEEETLFKDILRNYFRLDTDLSPLYQQWSEKDPLFETAAKQFYGIRIVAQDPVENLFSFICSQNNHISRISGMVEKLCEKYGEKICDVDGRSFYSFPEPAALAPSKVEGELRTLGFGYRAKFIQQSAAKIVEWGDRKWFDSLMNLPYKEAKLELIKLPGIGPKVADCICLMSLNHLEAVPVDTHVYQIASQNYLKHLKGLKSVTDRVYNEIGDHFRELYGPLAGWAHTVLFCADLKKFQENGATNTDEGPKAKKIKKKR